MHGNGTFSLVDQENDKKTKPVLADHVMKSSIENKRVFGTNKFHKFSSWIALVRAFLPFYGTEYVPSNKRVLTIVAIYLSRPLQHFSYLKQWVIKAVERETFSGSTHVYLTRGLYLGTAHYLPWIRSFINMV